MVLDGDHVIHATMLHGVVRQSLAEAMKDQVLVHRREFDVPDVEAGLAWVRTQEGTEYDFEGAFGVSLKPDREWSDNGSWFCHELCAAFLHACGRRLFSQFGHVTDASLMLASTDLSSAVVDGRRIIFSPDRDSDQVASAAHQAIRAEMSCARP